MSAATRRCRELTCGAGGDAAAAPLPARLASGPLLLERLDKLLQTTTQPGERREESDDAARRGTHDAASGDLDLRLALRRRRLCSGDGDTASGGISPAASRICSIVSGDGGRGAGGSEARKLTRTTLRD